MEKRKSTTESGIHKYFSKVFNEADKSRCNFCTKLISKKDSSTSNMWKHLRSKHSLQMSMQSTQESGNGGNKEGQNEKNDTDEHSQVNIHTKKNVMDVIFIFNIYIRILGPFFKC